MATMELAKPGQEMEALALIEQGRARLAARGIDQWQDGYPNLSSLQEDLRRERGYFLLEDGSTAGYLCLDFAGEPAYEDLEGRWLGNGPYGVIHRLVVGDAFAGQGLAKQAFALAGEICRRRGVPSLRVDTHQQNRTMRGLLERMGFSLCGAVHYPVSGERLAYEKLLMPAALDFQPLDEGHAQGLLPLWSDGEALWFTNMNPLATVEEARQRIRVLLPSDSFALVREGEVLGVAGCLPVPGQPGSYGLYYQLKRAAWGHGHGTAAALWVLDHMRQTHGEPLTFLAEVAVENPASERILRRCGFRMTGERQAWHRGRAIQLRSYQL